MTSDEVIDTITDSDGDRIAVEAHGPHVYLTSTSKGFTACVRLSPADQERFAQAYVAACHQAKAEAELPGRAAVPGVTSGG